MLDSKNLFFPAPHSGHLKSSPKNLNSRPFATNILYLGMGRETPRTEGFVCGLPGRCSISLLFSCLRHILCSFLGRNLVRIGFLLSVLRTSNDNKVQPSKSLHWLIRQGRGREREKMRALTGVTQVFCATGKESCSCLSFPDRL